MRIIKEVLTAPAQATSLNFQPYNTDYLQGYSMIVSIANQSSLNGTLKIQVSNNAFLDNVNNNLDPNAVWDDLPGSTNTITTNGTVSYNVSDVQYGAFRLVYTRTAGTADFTVYVRAKGISSN